MKSARRVRHCDSIASQRRWLAAVAKLPWCHGSVWSQCRSWYRMDNGKVVALFPGFTREYVEALDRPDFAEFSFG